MCPETGNSKDTCTKLMTSAVCHVFKKSFCLITSSQGSNSSNRMELRKLFTYNYIKRLILFSVVTQMSLRHECETEIYKTNPSFSTLSVDREYKFTTYKNSLVFSNH